MSFRTEELFLWGFVLVASAGCKPAEVGSEKAATGQPTTNSTSIVSSGDSTQLRSQIDAFCGGCHGSPPAESFPKDAWAFEVERGYNFYFESFREDLNPPPRKAVISYYESLAPAELHVRRPEQTLLPGPLEFKRRHTAAPNVEPPAVSYITTRSLTSGQDPQLVLCDMRSGEVRTAAAGKNRDSMLLASCANPAHIEPCDLDGDGATEFVIAELGSARSGDHSRGAVIWLRPDGDGWKQRLLLSGLGRVADVQPADFDLDGDSDLLVAEFGHFRTGRILWLENTSVVNGIPRFTEHVLDERHGTIVVPVADLDSDGDLDFVALISQEYELVEAFLNQGDGTFRKQRVIDFNDPAYGSSSIQIIDMDADDDLDLLYSNGDTFGSEHLKSYHGIHWLENRGQYPFTDHFLAGMVGVQKSLAGDLDGDHDLDVVAVALMPKNLVSSPELKHHDSVVWLEQTEPGTFVRHSLERGRFYHAGLELADFDHDGDLDFAVGNMHPDDEPIQPWVTIWSNQQTADVNQNSVSENLNTE